MRVTRDALAVGKPMWMLGDSAYDTLDWITDIDEANAPSVKVWGRGAS